MGYVLHARARTTPEVRREIQHSQESLIALSKRYGVNPKTIEKWRKRNFVHDVPMGPKVVLSKSLTPMTRVNHPWTNGQVERMNRTIKEATVGRYHYGSHGELKKHLHAFLMAYNLASRLKTLKGKSPYDFIRAVWTTETERFIIDPNQFTMGPYT